MSPTSRIMCRASRLQVSSSTCMACFCSSLSGGMTPLSENRVSDRT